MHKHDFDFIVGNWKVHHHRLKARLAGSHEWEDFEGTSTLHYILGGDGTIDDNVIELPSGTYRAATLRTYDPKSRQWFVWWFDGRTPTKSDPPMAGSFKDRVGTFYGDDTFNGRPIKVRFLWTRIDTPTPRWEQAFSVDGGKSWETNWVMDFRQ
ncbi:MAG: DUF1579 domain-containing protein [Alphaproteobacteria bacterium]|nr:DUF1579 domain-containing protein [Alphaproteobacteria bacterium]